MFTAPKPFASDHIKRLQRNYRTAHILEVQHRVDELWRRVRTAIQRNHDVTRVIANHEKVSTRGRDPRRQPHFFEASSRETSGNSREELWVRRRRASEVVEALRLKHLGTGYNLLMYAASEGRTESFDSLVKIVKQRLGRRGLVKQLQGSDLHEAPVLFQAASSSSVQCFKHVLREIRDALGKGELRQQLLAKDLKGKTVVFHAACSQNVDIFETVIKLLATEKGELPGDESWLAVFSSSDRCGCAIIDGVNIEIDFENKTVLHHACNTGSAAIMSRIIEEAKLQGETFLRGFLHRSDYLGRTPVMHVLRSRGNDVSEKLIKLLQLMTPEEKVVAMTQPTESFFSTALAHAAYGGSREIEIARQRILEIAPSTRNADGNLDLDAALGIGNASPEKIQRYGALLAEAAYGGHDDMLKYVISALQTGVVRKRNGEHPQSPYKKDFELSIKEIADDPSDRGTLFTLAIASGKSTPLYNVRDLIREVMSGDPHEIWRQLCGSGTRMNNLALASSISASGCDGGKLFEVVFEILNDAANAAYQEVEVAKEELLKLFVSKQGDPSMTVDTPLTGAICSNDFVLFKTVCDRFKHLNGGTMTLKQVGDQLPIRFHFGMQGGDLNPAVFKIRVSDLSPSMLVEIIKVLQTAERSKDEKIRYKEEMKLSRRMRSLVQVAAERGAFDLFRVLAYSDERLHLESIPILLERIGESEENIIDAIMLSIICTRNPFVASAEVSKCIHKAEVDLPMHRDRLRHLQDKISALIQEVLRVLPHTVKGVGETFAAHSYALVRLKSNGTTQRMHDQMAIKIGYVIMERILEPATTALRTKDKIGSGKSEDIGTTIDPLQYALDTGSKALDFINSPLVLDYLRLKFTRSTPSWLSADPFDHNASQRYYRYRQKNPYAVSAGEEKETAPDVLMRILQGWDAGDKTGEQETELSTSKFPHVTLLPGLQFLLAGMIGKPSAYYDVPLIRFTYELFGYIVMLVLFETSVLIRDPHRIPRTEIAFYVLVLGMLWREVLEFRDVVPKPAHPSDRNSAVRFKTPAPRMTLALSRYLFQDAWNILDTSTIFLVVVAFSFRVAALREETTLQRSSESETTQLGGSAFMAQVFLASTAPLLFARILSLSQIDSTLGPMTQIIWRMLSHLARFSVFIVVLISSFALTFNVLLGGCAGGNEAYATLADAHLTMFRAMLGDFSFEHITGSNACRYPHFTDKAATILLLFYLVIVTILLMNLLIAVLSTVHSEVSKNTEREFNLARAKLIQQSWRLWRQGRQPPPVNLLRPVAGLLLDLIFELYGMIKTRDSRGPISQTQEWETAMSAIHRLIFSLIMGPVAGATLVGLWTISMPWIAWCFFCWFSEKMTKETHRSWQKNWSSGYVRPLCVQIFTSFCWAIALIPAALLSIGYAVLTLPLWSYGVLDICQWYRIQSDKMKSPTLESPEDIVSDMNDTPGEKSPHFRVDYLVKMTAGLDLEDLTRLTNPKSLRGKKNKSNSDYDEVSTLPIYLRSHFIRQPEFGPPARDDALGTALIDNGQERSPPVEPIFFREDKAEYGACRSSVGLKIPPNHLTIVIVVRLVKYVSHVVNRAKRHAVFVKKKRKLLIFEILPSHPDRLMRRCLVPPKSDGLE